MYVIDVVALHHATPPSIRSPLAALDVEYRSNIVEYRRIAMAAQTIFVAPARCTDRRLMRQLGNLRSFELQCAALWKLFRYSPWTTPGVQGGHMRLEPSRLVSGSVGVAIPWRMYPAHAFIVSYPGLLVWRELHDRFNQRYHCPTAVDLPLGSRRRNSEADGTGHRRSTSKWEMVGSCCVHR